MRGNSPKEHWNWLKNQLNLRGSTQLWDSHTVNHSSCSHGTPSTHPITLSFPSYHSLRHLSDTYFDKSGKWVSFPPSVLLVPSYFSATLSDHFIFGRNPLGSRLSPRFICLICSIHLPLANANRWGHQISVSRSKLTRPSSPPSTSTSCNIPSWICKLVNVCGALLLLLPHFPLKFLFLCFFFLFLLFWLAVTLNQSSLFWIASDLPSVRPLVCLSFRPLIALRCNFNFWSIINRSTTSTITTTVGQQQLIDFIGIISSTAIDLF